MRAPSLAEVINVLELRYEPATAADWDSIGLVVGDPGASIKRVLFALDPVGAIVDQAISTKADLLLTHHPLFLRPVHGVPASNWKGTLAHRLIKGNCALFTAHTNADRANPGVNDALAAALEVSTTGWLTSDGLGRLGHLDGPMTLRDFASRVRASLPIGATGIRVAGDSDRRIETVALCGGAGDDLFDQVRASGVDVYVTSDLRHHPISEAIEVGGPAFIDAGHFATEWPWLAQAARLLVSDLADIGASVEAEVSSINTDAWSNV
jgi:dinuclear metal center YbgI/SA1388 family protein